MPNKYVIGIAEDQSSDNALKYAVEVAKVLEAPINLIHVLEWSPYSFLTAAELEERHKRRNDELSRAQAAILDPILTEYQDAPVQINTEVRYGQIADVINNYANDINASHIFLGKTGKQGIGSRLFGSVPSIIVQIADIPVTVIP